MSVKKTIFISIASYRDPELLPTLRDMMQQATCPANLHIAICWQHADEGMDYFLNEGMTLLHQETEGEMQKWAFSYRNALVEVLPVHYFQSKGACWARHCSETLYRNEHYFLQIDSHCRFIAEWDSSMIALLESLRPMSAKPILTGYPPAYEPGKEESKANKVNRLLFREFDSQGIVMFKPSSFEGTEPLRGCYLAGGFIFADGSFVHEVPNDPHIFFAGEEIAMSVRAFTWGYDVYYPHKLLLWHFYGRRENKKVWGDHNNEAKAAGLVDSAWWERDRISKKRVRSVLKLDTEPCDTGIYTTGPLRTLQQFEQSAGVFFQQQAVLPEVINGDRIGFFADPLQNEPLSVKSFIYPNKRKIKFPADKIDISCDDIAWWHIGVYDKQNALLEKIEVSQSAAANTFKEEGDGYLIDIEFSSFKRLQPHVVRVCPYLTAQGWGETVEKPW